MQVAENLGRLPNVCLDKVHNRLLNLSSAIQPRDRNPQPFLINITDVRETDTATYIGGMSDSRGEGDETAIQENWYDHAYVEQVTSSSPRIIPDDHLPPRPTLSFVHSKPQC